MLARVLVALILLCGSAHAQIGSPSAANVGNHGPICPGNGALCGPVPTAAFSIAFDNSATLGSNGGSGNFSASYTGSTLTHGLLVATIVGDTVTDALTAVAYGGQALSLGAKIQVNGERWLYLYYKLGPLSGANNLTVTQTGGSFIIVNVAEYSGVLQSSQPDNTATNDSGGAAVSTLSKALTINNANSWVMIAAEANVSTFVDGTLAKFRVQDSLGVDGLYDSNAAQATGSHTYIISISPDSKIMGMVLVSFQPG